MPDEDNFAQSGRAWLRGAVQNTDLARLKAVFPASSKPGARLTATDPLFQCVASLSFQSKITTHWPGMRPVRMVTFNKSRSRNWGVPWHQDRIIAVADKAEVPGFSNWSQKHGTWHCEPPESLLNQMLFVRLHLDPNRSDNGAMQIAVGSHTQGIVPAAQADAIANAHPQEATIASAGDVLIMAMTLLHKSDPAENNDTRRAIRIDYAPCDLPAPLCWALDH